MGFIVGFGEMAVIALIIFAVTFMYVVPALRRRAALMEKPKRTVRTDSADKVIRMEAREKSRSFHHSGKGTYASGTLTLYAGVYRLEYKFPEAAPVALKLLDIDSAEEQVLLIKSGSGSQAFRVDANGRFVLNIDPTDSVRAWEVSFRQM